MKHLSLSLLSALALAACASTTSEEAPAARADADWETFGAEIPAAEVVAVESVLAEPELYDGKTVLIEGTIDQVCPKKGCWMTLGEEDRSMRVTFEDYAFFVPMDSSGRRMRAEGTVSIRVVPVDEVRHYLEDAGKHEEAAAVTEPMVQVEMVASGVRIAPAASG